MQSENLNEPEEPAWSKHVRAQVASLRFGAVQIQVHEGRVVQVERTERLRFEGLPAKRDLSAIKQSVSCSKPAANGPAN